MNLNDDPQLASLRVPPHSIESESSLLGGLLLDNSAWDRVGDLLLDSDFYRVTGQPQPGGRHCYRLRAAAKAEKE